MIDALLLGLGTLRSAIGRFRRARSGVAGIEFALTFPLLLVIVAASVDLNQALAARRKAFDAAATLAGFVADQNQWTSAEVDELLAAGSLIIQPFETQNLRIVLSILDVSADKQVTVADSRAFGTSPLRIGAPSPVTISNDIRSPDINIVLAQVDYSLTTPFSKLWPSFAVADQFEFSAHYLARPRRSDKIRIE